MRCAASMVSDSSGELVFVNGLSSPHAATDGRHLD
jgi:hypothetical protein